jgi:hypothetical protein
MARCATAILLLAIMAATSGCGSGSGQGLMADPPPKVTSSTVTVTPSGIGQVLQGTTVQFSANVPVSWSVREGNVGGKIDSTGLYTAPSAAGTFHVVATSVANPSATGTASVQVPELIVEISPATETLREGGQRRFGGFALAADPSVTWKLQEGAAAGTITADGLYTAPSKIGTFHVIATSVFNPNVSSTATVTVVNTGFTPIGKMATARYRHSATLLVDGRVLLAGGTSDATHSAELFAPASGSFAATTGGMIQVRSGHCSALLPNGKVLIAGGGGSASSLFKTAELFDVVTQSFTATGDLNQARDGATATLLTTGKTLIAGGKDSTGASLSTAELYDPNTGSFTVTGTMQMPRVQHTATLLANGKVLLIGSSTSTAAAELYDPVSGKFTPTGSLLHARAHHTATLLPNGKVLVVGGTLFTTPEGGGAQPADISLSSTEIYDPATGTFQSAGDLVTARGYHSATLLPNGTVLIAGGYSQGFDGDADPFVETMFAAEVFNPSTGSTAAAASLVGARAEHMAVLLNNRQVLVTGGREESQELCCRPTPVIANLDSAELYE